MNKVIFIEGVSGVGKTTMTTQIYKELQNKKYDVSYFLEGTVDNPFDPFGGTYPPKITISEFKESYYQYWYQFSESNFDNKIMITDGTLLHHPINDLIREFNATDDEIANFLCKLSSLIHKVNPIIFYLSSSNVRERLFQARKSRNQSETSDAKIAFWENRKRIDLKVLKSLPVESHVLCVDNGWDSICKKIIKLLEYNAIAII